MTMTNASGAGGFRPRTREVIESFLQSVVVLDDLAEMSPALGTPPSETLADPLTAPDYPQTTAPPDSIAVGDPRGAPLDAESVINGFADLGSVCAVLSATPGHESRERTVRAAKRADIVVLDWKIGESVGGEALSVMREILRDDYHGRRLRLMAIYTGEPDLNGIHGRVRAAADEFYEDDELMDDPASLRISKGPLHIVVLAKAGVLPSSDRARVSAVSESELAVRLTEEFALMAGGLLRNVAISGIAAVRDNAHRILAKFGRRLDPGYLGHRLLLPHPPDAEDHVEAALGSEITSVIEEQRPGYRANIEAIESWLTRQSSDGLDLLEPFPFQGQPDPVGRWPELLLKGIGPGVELPEGGRRQLEERATEVFTANPAEALQSSRQFAALLSLKTRYHGRPPRLSIGTVLRTEGAEEPRYFLCLQPKCDSVRLNAATGFPLIPLTPLALTGGSNGALTRLVAEVEHDQWEFFEIGAKPSELIRGVFEPGDNPPGEVLASEGQPGRFYFDDANGDQRYWWVADLKDEHALRVAAEVANALSRPGPNDSEWLRRARGSPR